GCLRAAAATARELRRLVAEDELGPATPGTVTFGAPCTVRGDLQRMLGFREGGLVERRFDAPLLEFELRRSPPAPGEGTPRVVHCGTSFSHSFPFAAFLETELSRRVEDRSVAGRGPFLRLSELIAEVREGRREPPRVVVWEIPEKHLVVRGPEFLIPMERFLIDRENEDLYPEAGSRPLTIEILARHQLGPEIGPDPEDGWIRGAAEGGGDPQLICRFGEPLPLDGNWALAYRVTTNRPTTSKVLFDWGRGFDREGEEPVALTRSERPQLVVVPIPAGHERLVRLRIDPIDAPGPFAIGDFHLRRRR
ncbi:MAG: hypothetical protein R3F20_16310, partial [Planctomycetota bacterium]